MDDWSIATYGSPCRECGFSWSLGLPDILGLMRRVPSRFRETIGDASGTERHPDLRWSVTAYVCHVADNLHIWSERLQGAIRGGSYEVGAHDENELADARRYDAIDPRAALWSLTRSAEGWIDTMDAVAKREATGHRVTLVHPERGELQTIEIARSNYHDSVHHLWDVERTLAVASS